MDAHYRFAGSDSLQPSLALAIAAAIMLVVANTAPLMSLSVAGLHSSTTIAGGAFQMWRQGYRATAGAVLFCAVLAPAGFILFALASLLGASRPSAPKWLPALTRWAGILRHWAMPEVMLLALLVALTKMAEAATVVPGIGMYAAGALVVLSAALSQRFDPEKASATPRKPGSVQRTWALIVAAAICYVPANLLPVLNSSTLVSAQSDTIMSGVIFLFASGSWPLGLIVLVASVMIPLGKLASLAYLLVSVQRGSAAHCGDRGHLLRIVDAIGRWSMLDVFVVAFVAALMQLQPLLSAQPGPGVPFFAAVVILTMLAARSFDPRLIPDAARRPRARDV
jgi:paraquat-inducible protein A